MPLELQRPEGVLQIRRADAREVLIGQRTYTRSLLVAADRVVEDWPPDSVAALRPEHADACLEFQPELILLGTGERQCFPPPDWLVLLPRRGVGCEVMNNAACARTFNLLVAEGRRVVAGLLLTAT